MHPEDRTKYLEAIMGDIEDREDAPWTQWPEDGTTFFICCSHIPPHRHSSRPVDSQSTPNASKIEIRGTRKRKLIPRLSLPARPDSHQIPGPQPNRLIHPPHTSPPSDDPASYFLTAFPRRRRRRRPPTPPLALLLLRCSRHSRSLRTCSSYTLLHERR